jgi:hypothetical protein
LAGTLPGRSLRTKAQWRALGCQNNSPGSLLRVATGVPILSVGCPPTFAPENTLPATFIIAGFWTLESGTAVYRIPNSLSQIPSAYLCPCPFVSLIYSYTALIAWLRDGDDSLEVSQKVVEMVWPRAFAGRPHTQHYWKSEGATKLELLSKIETELRKCGARCQQHLTNAHARASERVCVDLRA